MEYNRALRKAGVLLALDGLFPPSMGARISYKDGKTAVTYAPFAAAAEVIDGYWIIQVRSREEAVEWARRAPMSNNEVIEIRQIRDTSGIAEGASERFEHRT